MQVYIVNQNASLLGIDINSDAERLCLDRWYVEESTNVNVLVQSNGSTLKACEIASRVVSELGYRLITVDKCVIVG